MALRDSSLIILLIRVFLRLTLKSVVSLKTLQLLPAVEEAVEQETSVRTSSNNDNNNNNNNKIY